MMSNRANGTPTRKPKPRTSPYFLLYSLTTERKEDVRAKIEIIFFMMSNRANDTHVRKLKLMTSNCFSLTLSYDWSTKSMKKYVKFSLFRLSLFSKISYHCCTAVQWKKMSWLKCSNWDLI